MPVNSRERGFDILVPSTTPWAPVRVALSDPPSALTWPHVEEDGVLCLAPAAATYDTTDPVAVARHLLGEGVRLVERIERGELRGDFEAEFISYWSRGQRKPDSFRILSLCDPRGPTRVVHSFFIRNGVVLAESEEEIITWVSRWGGDPQRSAIGAAPFIQLAKLPSPGLFPSNLAMLAAMGGGTGAVAEVIESAQIDIADQAVVILGAPAISGQALFGIHFPRWSIGRRPHKGATQAGFRPGSPQLLRARRTYSHSRPTVRVHVDRIDGEWIHGRGRDETSRRLSRKSAAFIGCGSLGSPAIEMLARAGVGRLLLVDPDQLDWSNLGRHVLGARSIGKNKAKEMANKLKSDLPHLHELNFEEIKIEDLLLRDPDALCRYDLIITTTGDWAGNSFLSDWHRATTGAPPLLCAWSEPHALAGHALLITDGVELRDAFHWDGTPRFTVTAWSDEQSMREPACGVTYQPYGPIEIGRVAALAADLAVETLLSEHPCPTHRIWASTRSRIESAGGSCTAEWLALSIGPHTGGFAEMGWNYAQSA